jgi:hypothetical protein
VAAHATPQAPQLRASDAVSVQKPPSVAAPQAVVLPAHCTAQAPFEQTCPCGHTVVQLPQCALSVASAAQKVPDTSLQAVVPPTQPGTQ